MRWFALAVGSVVAGCGVEVQVDPTQVVDDGVAAEVELVQITADLVADG
ncbi:MAG: hypothetical protein ABMB14_01570 [Myxococcota bacterium]